MYCFLQVYMDPDVTQFQPVAASGHMKQSSFTWDIPYMATVSGPGKHLWNLGMALISC